jgi:hypothetical protein
MYDKRIFGIFAGILLATGCSDVAAKFRNQYDPSRTIVDQGGSNVISTGNACALDDRDAKENAEKTAEYHLRGIMGSGSRYIIQTQAVDRYTRGDQICYEASAIAIPK